jgi:hypothetical protein
MQEVNGDTAVIRYPNVTVAHRRSHDDQELGRRGGGGALMVELTAHRGWRDLDISDDHRILLQLKDLLRDNRAVRPEDRPPVEEPWPRD